MKSITDNFLGFDKFFINLVYFNGFKKNNYYLRVSVWKKRRKKKQIYGQGRKYEKCCPRTAPAESCSRLKTSNLIFEGF